MEVWKRDENRLRRACILKDADKIIGAWQNGHSVLFEECSEIQDLYDHIDEDWIAGFYCVLLIPRVSW